MVSVFVDVFIFVSNVHIHAAILAQTHHYMTSKQTTQSGRSSKCAECYDWPRAAEFLNFNDSGLARVHVLCLTSPRSEIVI